MAKTPNTTTAPTGQIAPFGLRMLPELREKIEAGARESGRSMNAEIVARLQQSFEEDKVIERVAFESSFETTTLRQEIARLTGLLEQRHQVAEASPAYIPALRAGGGDIPAAFTQKDIEQIASKAAENALLLVLGPAGGINSTKFGKPSGELGQPPNDTNTEDEALRAKAKKVVPKKSSTE